MVSCTLLINGDLFKLMEVQIFWYVEFMYIFLSVGSVDTWFIICTCRALVFEFVDELLCAWDDLFALHFKDVVSHSFF